ncbi:MAG: flagellar M-ring protein FliF [Opitutaceae bacterium]|nr:flagellar M-ring protein FliF [Opitutaceae bacterium]
MRILAQLLELWKQLGINQKISLVLATLVVVAAMAGMLVWSSRPDMQLLYGRLDPKDAGDIVAALDAQGIPYQLTGGGTTIHVPREQVYKVRMDLASRGMPSGGSVGFEIFDRGNFGISDFVQRTNYLRAIQGELGRTISQLDGVRAARVMVVMPENRLLVTDAGRRSTASVLVDTGGNRLATEAVNSIRSLVANAVEGLKIDDVVVVDNRGNVLSEELRSDSPAAGLTAGQIRARKGLEDYFGRKVESMLSSVLGPGNAVVRVSVDVDTTASTVVEERYDPESQVLRSSTVTEDSNVSSETRDTRVVGATANTPTAQGTAPGAEGAGAGPTTSSQQKRTSKTEAYEIARSTINTVKNPGEIRRISAAVFVAMRATGSGDARQTQPRTADEMENLRRMVVTALGVPASGAQPADQAVTIQEVDFAPDPFADQTVEMAKDAKMRNWFDIGRNALAIVVAIGALLYFVRLLKNSKAEAISLEVYNPAGAGAGPRKIDLEGGSVTPELLNELIKQKPDNVGITLKQWMSAEQK